jgi:uncharacterized protein (DUF2252 family)
LVRKQARMSASPLAFLRGSAPLFYELLAAEPELAAGPAGSGIIQGDTHVENFGAYSPAVHDAGGWKKGHATFQLNDFDEASRGPWRWDVLRLTTSLLLAGRELGQSGPAVLRLCEVLVQRHVATTFAGAPLPAPPPSVVALIERVDGRSPRKLLDARTQGEGAARRFVRGDRYTDAPPELVRAVPAALALFAERTASTGGPKPEQLEVLDVAFRIAGTGSLGALRLAVLTQGKGGDDGGWLFDLKEQQASSVDVLAPRVASSSRAGEVEQAFRLCVANPPRMLGTSQLGEHDMLVRRLTPQEDKLSLNKLDQRELPALAAYLGALLGAAHRRARDGDFPAWSARDCSALLERAVTLASLHEAVYLQLCLAAYSGATATATNEHHAAEDD